MANDVSITLPQFNNNMSGNYFVSSLPQLSLSIKPGNIISLTLPSMIVQAGQNVRGDGNIILPSMTFSTVVQQGSVEVIDVSLPMLTINAFSGHQVSITLPQFTLNAIAQSGMVGTFGKSLPRLTVNVKASQEIISNVNITFPSLTLTTNVLTGTVSVSGSNRTLPLLTINAHAFNGVNGDVAITLPIMTLVTEVVINPTGAFAKSLSMFTLDAYADVHTNRIV